ncbi:interferon-related developmental regulator-domain-containing protein [Syncephalastrum racemosum]|uniref:Interferon-related developmental regulator-domain-containing protein n=1 Tax=Syncephalastrum racemosum TaxID=13706 RepID=A0A1X2HGH0_SYNRA|nr:interferon-related developmental regulator-domain-containing protein [Syncephalastrum racemosum]
MPARRNTRKAREEDPEDLGGPAWINSLNRAIDDLTVNRTSVREEALSVLNTELTRHYAADILESRSEELLTLLRRSVSKGGKEAHLAAQAIALHFVNQGDLSLGDQEDLFQQVLPLLRKTVKNTDDTTLQSICLRTLALITLIAASDIDAQLARDFVYDVLEEIDDYQVQCAALHAYGLLCVSSFSQPAMDPDIIHEEIEKVMPVHEILLESTDMAVRVAAGENTALLFELLRTHTGHPEDEEDQDEEVQDVPEEYDNMDGLIHTLKELSVDSNRRRNKADRAEQKSVFRDIVRSVEERDPPVQELKIGGRVIQFRGWAKILTLNAFRQSIGQGLQYHLRANELMHQIFNYKSGYAAADSDDDSDGWNAGELSKADKRYVYDESKKMRSKQLREARTRKAH